ncbi:MAG: hypothetical protein ACC628_08495 [Pirellulaceae bacterium]
MESSPQNAALPGDVRRSLSKLRRRIRAYLWLHGICVALVWLGATFWIGLAIDYLPVLVGANELSRAARAVMLAVVSFVLAWILYRWILRRILVRMSDYSMAVLLERRFTWFRDSLITSVELGEASDLSSETSRELLAATRRDAQNRLQHVRVTRALNFRPLRNSAIVAATFVTAVLVFYLVNAPAMAIGVNRLYLLRDHPWPRRAHLEIVGVELQRMSPETGAVASRLVPFQQRRVKVAKGTHVRLVVRADASARVVPEICTIYYRTEPGDRGRVNMTTVGGIRSGYQEYKYDGEPLKGILTSVSLDVVGADHRVRDFKIEAVESPAVIDCQLDCVFPSYMVDEALSQWLPRTIPLTSGTRVPRGTRLALLAKANKPLRRVQVRNPETDELTEIRLEEEEGDGTTFVHQIPSLDTDLALEITLTDMDGIVSQRPFRAYVSAMVDEPPSIDVTLDGVSTVITPDALVQIQGTIEDDYGVARSWFEVVINDGDVSAFAFDVGRSGTVEAHVDFREQRTLGVALKPKDTLQLTAKAADKYDLGEGPNMGSGDHYQLDVVTPDELLAMLEAREIGLRRRFEQILEETTETRDMLLRVKTEGPGSTTAHVPLEEEVDATAETDEATREAMLRKRVWTLRLLRAQQALLQSQKAAQETLGVAASFLDVRQELICNRVDTEDRKRRLKERVAEPLQEIGNHLFPELDERLKQLISLLDGDTETLGKSRNDDPRVVSAADDAVQDVTAILVEMNTILQQMLDLETYNELLDIVRALIGEQERLMNETKKQQKKQVLDLLNDANAVEPSPGDALTVEQGRVADKYARLEKLMIRMSEIEAATHPQRASLLRRAVRQSSERLTRQQLNAVTQMLAPPAKLKRALDEQEQILADMESLLELLLSENRSDRLKDEQTRVREYIKEVDRLIRLQRSIQGRTEGGEDTEKVAEDQAKVSDRTGELVQEIRENEEGLGREGEQPPSEENPSEGDRKKAKSADQKPEPAKKTQSEPKKPGESSGQPTPGDLNQKPGRDPEQSPGKPQGSQQQKPSGQPPQEGPPPGSQSTEAQEKPEKQSSENPARQRLEAARQRMRAAEQKLQEAKRNEAVDEQEEARRELEKAKAALEEILQQLRDEEVGRMLAMLEARFRRMLEIQLRVYQSTQRLDKIPAEQRGREVDIQAGKLSFEENKLVVEADKALLLLREEGSSVAFPETVEQMRDDMTQVTDLLAVTKTGAITQGYEEDVISAPEEMIEALQKAQQEQEEKKEKRQQQRQVSPQDIPLVDQLAEIKMIRSLQLRVNTRTQRYARLLENMDDPVGQAEDEDLMRALEKLAEKQRRIHRVTRDIVLEKNK